MRYKFGGIFIAILFLVNLATAQVQVTLPDTTADWGGKITLPVQVSDVSAYQIFSYEFIINFNSSVLKLNKADHLNTIAANWATPVFNDSTPGTLVIGGYGTNKLTGQGKLVNITFDVIGNPGDMTNLTFSYSKFNNGSPPAATTNGRVNIKSNLVAVTITTNVLDGTEITVDGQTHIAPYTSYWEIDSQHQISVPSPQTFGDKRYVFKSWNDGGAQSHTVFASQPMTFTGKLDTQYKLTLQSSYGTPQGAGWYNAGSIANFSVEDSVIAENQTKYVFQSWNGSGPGSYSGEQRNASVVMNNPITETANWSAEYYIDIISAHGNPYGTGWYSPGSTVTFGIDSTTIIRSDARYQFLSWTGTGSGSYSGTNPQSTINITGSATEHANWDAEYLVVTGSEPEGILQVPGAGWYQQNKQFTTISAPDTVTINRVSYAFKGWKINGNIVPGNPVTLAIDAPKTIIADYSKDITVVVTTNVGTGTKVIVDGEEKNAPFSTSWVAGAKHSIGVVAVQNGTPGIKYIFQQWGHGGKQTQDVAPTSNVTYIADLETQYYLDVSDNAGGAIHPPGTGWYAAMSVVKLDSLVQNKVSAQTSFRFIKWQVDGIDSIKKSVAILMDKPHAAIAFYRAGFYISGTITFVGIDVVPVSLMISGDENFTVHSDDKGTYLVAGLSPGDYTITLQHPGYRFEPSSRTYQVSKNEENQYYFAFPNPNAVIVRDNSDLVPNQFELGQNYPNPFADLTVIEYGLKKQADVKLIVYNVLGQVVKQLVGLHEPAGRYRIQWDRTDLSGAPVPSGVYFYRIETGDFVKIKKMIVL